MVPLPDVIRTRVPRLLRDDPSLRALSLAVGLIPPRTMHSEAEADVLSRLARGASRVVEIGVYEGSSAVLFCHVLTPGAELHLIDPFLDESGWSLPAGARASPLATRQVVRRAAGRGGPRIHWHIARSQEVGHRWEHGQEALVFIDGDHSPSGCREDWELWRSHVRPGGFVAFHDARAGHPGGCGSPGPTSVVDGLFRTAPAWPGWSVAEEVDSVVVLRRLSD